MVSRGKGPHLTAATPLSPCTVEEHHGIDMVDPCGWASHRDTGTTFTTGAEIGRLSYTAIGGDHTYLPSTAAAAVSTSLAALSILSHPVTEPEPEPESDSQLTAAPTASQCRQSVAGERGTVDETGLTAAECRLRT